MDGCGRTASGTAVESNAGAVAEQLQAMCSVAGRFVESFARCAGDRGGHARGAGGGHLRAKQGEHATPLGKGGVGFLATGSGDKDDKLAALLIGIGHDALNQFNQ